MEFYNTAFVFLIISITPLQSMFTSDSLNLPKRYFGFESNWYAEVGKILVMTLGLNAFTANAWQFKNFILIMWDRFKDRGYNVHLQKYPDEQEDDDEPNTKKTEQKQLENLYKGGTFEHEQNMSRMMSIFLVIMFYSSGMPVMYIFAFFFYFFTYFVNKILFIQYYKKSKEFSYQIPITFAEQF